MLTAQPCPRQIHPKSSLPYDLNAYFHREGMKLHVFVRRDFWVSGLAPWLRHPCLALPCRQRFSWRRLPVCLRCKCHLGG